MKCPFCEEDGMQVEMMLVHLFANHLEIVPFPLYIKINEDGSNELLEEVPSMTMPEADLQTLTNQCASRSLASGHRCTELKGHEGPHKHDDREWDNL